MTSITQIGNAANGVAETDIRTKLNEVITAVNGGGGGTAGTLNFSIDGTLAGNSDVLLPTQKAVKTYVDAHAGGGAVAEIIGWPVLTPASGGDFGTGYYGYRYIIVPKTGNLTAVGVFGQAANGAAVLKPGVYARTAGNIAGALLAQGPAVTGFVVGHQELPLTAPLAVTKGDLIFVGAQISASSPRPALMSNVTETGYFASVGALVNPATASSGTLNLCSFYAVMDN